MEFSAVLHMLFLGRKRRLSRVVILTAGAKGVHDICDTSSFACIYLHVLFWCFIRGFCLASVDLV